MQRPENYGNQYTESNGFDCLDKELIGFGFQDTGEVFVDSRDMVPIELGLLGTEAYSSGHLCTEKSVSTTHDIQSVVV